MKKKKSRISVVLFCMICLIVQLCIGGQVLKVNAETISLEEGKTYSLSFQNESKPTMQFVMPDKGYFYYEIVPTYYTIDGKVYDAASSPTYCLNVQMMVNYKRYEKGYVYLSDPKISGKYAFQKGTKVNISITDYVALPYRSGADITAHFDIKVTVVKPKNFEKENNDSKKKANTIKKGKTYTGLVMLEDTDYYVFKAPKTGKYKITAAVSSARKDYDLLRVEVLKGTKRLKDMRMCYGDGNKTLWKGKLKKGQKLYLKFSGPSPVIYEGDLMYKLKVK